MNEFLAKDYDFLMSINLNDEIKSTIDLHRKEILRVKNYITTIDLNGITITEKLFKDEAKTVYYHIFFNNDYYQKFAKQLKSKIQNQHLEINSLLGKSVNQNQLEKYQK